MRPFPGCAATLPTSSWRGGALRCGRIRRSRSVAESEAFRRTGNQISWLLVPLLAGMQLVGLRRSLPFLSGVSAALVVFVGLTVLTAPWWWRRRGELGRWGSALAVFFLAAVAYALVSVAVHPAPVVHTSEDFVVETRWLVIPLLTAAAALFAGMGLVLAAEPKRRLPVLLAGCAAMAVTAVVAWPKQAAIHRSWRFATAMGGSATIHVAMLLASALGLACVVHGLHRRVGWAVALACLAGLIVTGSRAALLMLAAWLVILAAGRIRSFAQVKRLWPMWLGIAVLGGLVATVPALGRLVSFADVKRAQNLESSLTLWTSQGSNIVWGVGSGQVWPWYAFESGAIAVPGAGMVPSPAGEVLLSPHSTVLALVVELGGVGAVLGAGCVVALIGLLIVSRGQPGRFLVSAALVATLVASLFDTYWLKNFEISMLWWMMAALVSAWPTSEDVSIPEPVGVGGDRAASEAHNGVGQVSVPRRSR